MTSQIIDAKTQRWFIIIGVLLLLGFMIGTESPGILRRRMGQNPPPLNQEVACTLEAKICPDGSAVGRTGPNCEFAACPSAEK